MPFMWSPTGERVYVPSHMVQIRVEQGWSTGPPHETGTGGFTPGVTSPPGVEAPPGPEPPLPPGWQGGGTTTTTTTVDPFPLGSTPSGYEIVKIDGQLHLIYEVPVDADGDGQYDEVVPIAYRADLDDLIGLGLVVDAANLEQLLKDDLTVEEWNALGGINVGHVSELNNPNENPFELFVEKMVEASVLAPYILDPEVMALTGAAWLEGRSLNAAELAGTSYWQNSTQAQRDWLVLSSSSPNAAAQLLADNRTLVLEMLQQAGVNNATDTLVNLLADNMTTGAWTDVYLGNQIDLIADPAKRGELDDEVTSYLDGLDGFTLDTTQYREDRVRELVAAWLGPAFGQWTEEQVDLWAGRLRNDPDAEQRLEEILSRQRLALFPEYTDPQAQYEDIAAPWRNFVFNAWGQAPDETEGFFTDLVRMNDATDASRVLREEGLRRGVGKVTEDLLDEMSAAFGDSIVRAT